MSLLSAYLFLNYYVTLFFFGAFGLGLNLFGLCTGWLPATESTERFHRRLIRGHFALFVWWLGFGRLCRVHYHGLERIPSGGAVLVANHPGLMDITYLLARVPEAVCIFKPAIRRNPVLGAAARRAGYLASDGGSDLVRDAGAKVAAGHILVVFPEGTRTPPGESLLPLKPGFVLIARRADRPIQLIRISWNSNILVKGRAWWKLPQLPARVNVSVGPALRVPPEADATRFAAEIEAWYRAQPPVADAAGHAAPFSPARPLSAAS